MEIIREIKDIETLKKVVSIYETAYNRTARENIYKKVEDMNINNLKKEHRIINNLLCDHYKETGLYNIELANNEYDILYNNIIMELANNNIIYLYELANLIDYDLNYFKDYNINIKSEYHIIIDGLNKKIFDLTQEDEENIIYRLFEGNSILTNDYDIIEMLNIIEENTNLYFFNDQITIKELDLFSLDNFIYYNVNDKYIIQNLVTGKCKTINNLDLSYQDIIDNLSYLEEYILQIF